MSDGYTSIRCHCCDVTFKIRTEWRDSLYESGNTFYCPNGHSLSWKGKHVADELRRERDRLKQQTAQKDDEIRRLERINTLERRSTAAYKGQVTKIKKRVGKGVCPCCNRQFKDLHKHMNSKHPDYSEQEPDLKVVGGTRQ